MIINRKVHGAWRFTRGTPILAALASALGCLTLCAWGCSSNQRPEPSISQISSIQRPAKPPDCSLPILHSDISASAYQRVAIVEAWGDAGQENDVMDAVRRGACQTGADALLIISTQSQIDGRFSTRDLPKASDERPGETDSARRTRTSAEEFAPTVGQAGHAGYYIDGVALVKPDNGRANVSP